MAAASLRTFLLFVLSGAALAQSYPVRPVKLVMPFPPGGGSDIVVRLVAQALTPKLGQTVLVENVAGAAGNIGTQQVVRAAADGYTILFTPQSPATIANSLEPKPGFDVLRDLIPLALVGKTPSLVVIHPKIPATTLAELAALTKAQPGKYFFGSPGTAHEFHLAAELVLRGVGGEMTHVPYRGMGPAIQDTVAGQVHLVVAAVGSVKAFIADGRLRPIAAIGNARIDGYPNVPSTLEAGLSADAATDGWFGAFAPLGTPREIVDRLTRELLDLREDAGYVQKMKELNFEAVAIPAADFVRLIERQRVQWRALIQALKITGAG